MKRCEHCGAREETIEVVDATVALDTMISIPISLEGDEMENEIEAIMAAAVKLRGMLDDYIETGYGLSWEIGY